jgi:NRPS condensation-like uncharacterized protein
MIKWHRTSNNLCNFGVAFRNYINIDKVQKIPQLLEYIKGIVVRQSRLIVTV